MLCFWGNDIHKYDKLTYTYDTAGNILSKSTYDVTSGAVVTPTDVKQYKYANSGWKDRLVNYDGHGIAYDMVGNPWSYCGHTLEWSRIRLLTKWDDIEIDYNASGIRTRKGDTYYELDGDTIISETTCGDTIRYYYGNGGIVGFRYNGSRYYYEKNLQSDIVGIYDANGNKVGAYVYDAWGNTTITTNVGGIATVNPFRYRSYYYDSDLGLYYLKTRYYDAAIGRFINADSLNYLGANRDLAAYNLFAYCSDNPVNKIDSNGTSWKEFGETIANGAKKLVSAFLYSIEAEFGVGLGIGRTFEAGQYELSVSAYSNGYTFGLDDGYTYTANKGHLGADFSIANIISLGLATSYTHRYETGSVRVNDGHTAFTLPWELYDCEETEISNVPGISLNGIFESSSPSDLTISVGGSAHLIIGYNCSIGINISEFIKLLLE